MENWGKSNETSLSEKEDFYSQLIKEDTSNGDYVKSL